MFYCYEYNVKTLPPCRSFCCPFMLYFSCVLNLDVLKTLSYDVIVLTFSHHKYCKGSQKGRTCSVIKLCPTLCGLMDCSMLSSSVLHYLLEFAQLHVHRVGDAVFTVRSEKYLITWIFTNFITHPLFLTFSFSLVSFPFHWKNLL